MIDLLKADLYKAKKEKTLYILFAIAFGMALVMTLIIFLISFIFSTEQTGVLPNSTFSLFLFGFNPGSNLGIAIAIIIALFANRDFSLRTIHQRLVVGTDRKQILLSNFIVSATVCILTIIFHSLCNILFGTIFFGYPEFSLNEFFLILKYLFIISLSYTTLISLLFLFIYWIKKIVLAILLYVGIITISALIVTSFGQAKFDLIKQILEIFSYLPIFQLMLISQGFITNNLLLKVVLATIPWTALFLFLSILAFRKSDIK